MDAIEKHATVIALLGIDGCGKTTQAKQLAAWLEPGDASKEPV